MASRDVDRRTFIKTVLTAGMVVLSPFAQALRPATALAARRGKGFRFEHDESVSIVLKFAKHKKRYNLKVYKDGKVVEKFKNKHPKRFSRLNTKHFTVTYFDPAAA